MRFAQVKDKVVINISEAPEGWTFPDDSVTTVASDVAQIGWSYDGTDFTPPPPVPLTVPELLEYSDNAFKALLAAGRTFNVGSANAAVNILCDGTSATRADLALLALYAQANPSGSKTWIDNNGEATALTSVEIIALASQAGNWISDLYPAYTALVADITSANPTIKTIEDVEAYAWPTS